MHRLVFPLRSVTPPRQVFIRIGDDNLPLLGDGVCSHSGTSDPLHSRSIPFYTFKYDKEKPFPRAAYVSENEGGKGGPQADSQTIERDYRHKPVSPRKGRGSRYSQKPNPHCSQWCGPHTWRKNYPKKSGKTASCLASCQDNPP